MRQKQEKKNKVKQTVQLLVQNKTSDVYTMSSDVTKVVDII